MIDRAVEFATKAHEGQFRKGTRRPYIVHPIEVKDIVSTMTRDEEVISAAVLHDTIEDCQGVTREVLALEFSPRVAAMVAGLLGYLFTENLVFGCLFLFAGLSITLEAVVSIAAAIHYEKRL